MAIESYPVWTFEPNWTTSVKESLEWLTDIMTAPDGSEQRRALRLFPRRQLEFSAMAEDDARSLMDNLLISYGTAPWYLPLWHEPNILDADGDITSWRLVGTDFLDNSLIKVGSIVCIMQDDPYVYELAEVGEIRVDGVRLKGPPRRAWPKGSRVFPVVVGELTDQPQMAARTSRLSTTQVRFRVMDVEPDDGIDPASPTLGFIYKGFPTLPVSPEYSEPLKFDYERMTAELDNQLARPRRLDIAKRPFTMRQCIWMLEGRAEHKNFADILQYLRGRNRAVWVPTYFDDFIPMGPAVLGASTLEVARGGYTAAGGPRWDREFVVIELTGDRRIYRQILSSSQGIETERLTFDQPFNSTFSVQDIVRVSFMTLMRLNHDGVDIEHRTDTMGISTTSMTFRSAPDSRVVQPGFNG